MELIIFIIAILITAPITALIVYKILKPKLLVTAQINTETEQRNREILASNRILREDNEKLNLEQRELNTKRTCLVEEISHLNNSLTAMETQAQEAADLFYKTKMEVAENNFAESLKLAAENYQENVKSFEIQYNETVQNLMKRCNELSNNIAELKAANDAAVEAAKRAEELKTAHKFYTIQLSDIDITEIELLRSIEPHLRNKEPLNKVIWKCYYEKPTTDMIGRVIGSGTHTGIYKITNIDSGKCYIGQAANLADRWRQHIKRGIGAETPTRNKLYPAMNAEGPENFTFEVVEECERGLLDAREDYWQEYFKAKEFGYSIK